MKNAERELCINYKDELTGIYNRKGFYHATERLLAEYPDKEFVMVFWNVRRFKAINELFGRTVGDAILIHMAKLICESISSVGGTYGRLERDNFIMCFPSELIRNEEFVKSGDISYVKDGNEYHFASGFGLYIIEDSADSIAGMVDKSRLAMDAAGGNYIAPFAYYDKSMREKMLMEQEVMSDCETAIKENQFDVFYQPVCNAQDGTIASAEALVRWNHPKKGMISPGDFIPVFEKSGFICVLDRYVWDKVCRMLKERVDYKKDSVPVSVNVSRVDFYNHSLCEDIVNIVRKYDLNPEMIRIEITESAYSDNPQHVMKTVKKLQDCGFAIMMDDFGSGYSSLNTLKDLPVDVLKIDMKFMDDFKTGSKSAVIIESVVRMAKWMNLRVVAEGVETKEELNFLRSMECNYIQGYYFYKPMPEAEFTKLLNNPELVDLKSAVVSKIDEQDFSYIYNESMHAENIFQDMVGGMGIYELVDDRLEIIRVNRGYYEIMKPNYLRMQANERLVSNYMNKEDYQSLIGKCAEAEETGNTAQLHLRRKRCDGKQIWLDVKIRFLAKKGNRKIFYFYLMDITRIKELEQDEYLSKYTKTLFLVFDKVYHLDYTTGYAEVLHSVDMNMKTGSKIYFLDFFDRHKSDIMEIKNGEYVDAVKDINVLEDALKRTGQETLNIEYRIEKQEMNYHWISATFLKIERDSAADKVDYLVCIKRI